jgi:2-polyprenyl-6-methoxyphenol hydroxylase-like FAD-dependent oxidoreductase
LNTFDIAKRKSFQHYTAMSSSPLTQPVIAIVGGGPGGLVLARVLQVHGIQATVYESEAAENARDQGGTLDLHPTGGQWALKQAGLHDRFVELSRPEGQEIRIMNKDGYTYVHLDGTQEEESLDRPEIDRIVLRKMLVDSLDSDHIKWGHKVAIITQMEDERYRLEFTNGTVTIADIVVGSDGAWSKVRTLVSDSKPYYTGILFVETHLRDVDEKHPTAVKVVGNGTAFAMSPGRGLIPQRNGGSVIRTYAGLQVPDNWWNDCGIDWTDLSATKKALLEKFADFSDDLKYFIREAEDATARPIYALPTGHSWTHRKGVTLVGDAAHLMSPFAGEGANLALQDGADLAMALVEHIHGDGNFDAALQEYEARCIKRGTFSARLSAWGLYVCFCRITPFPHAFMISLAMGALKVKKLFDWLMGRSKK